MKSAVTIGLHGGRPTQTQIDRTAVCEKEAAQFAATFDKLAGAEMDGLNAKLKGANLPPSGG